LSDESNDKSRRERHARLASCEGRRRDTFQCARSSNQFECQRREHLVKPVDVAKLANALNA